MALKLKPGDSFIDKHENIYIVVKVRKNYVYYDWTQGNLKNKELCSAHIDTFMTAIKERSVWPNTPVGNILYGK